MAWSRAAQPGEEIPSSGLDLIVLLSGWPAPMRSTERFHGRLVEFFVHTEASFSDFVDREWRRRRSPLLHMCAHEVILRDRDGRLGGAAGPRSSPLDGRPGRAD